jgi:hypothetical protein
MSDTQIETPRDVDTLGRFVNANRRAERSAQQLANRPGDARLAIAEQHHRLEAQHARRELFRRTKMHAWNEGHEAVCSAGRECEEHVNPYVLVSAIEQAPRSV